jgi:NAD+ diphosphatase
VTDLRYFCSAPNQYAYRGVTYATCDLVFTGRLLERPRRIQESEIAGYQLLEPAEIELSRIAFPSLRGAMDRFLRVLAGDEV